MVVKTKKKSSAAAKRLPPRQLSGSADQTRQRVIARTAKLIAQGRVAQLTIRALARECGTSPMTLYNHFGSRGNLVSIAIAQTFGAFFELKPETEPASGDAIEELHELIASLVHAIEKKRSISQALLTGYFSADAEVHAGDVLFSMLHKRLLLVTERMLADQVVAAWADPKIVASEIGIRVLSAWMHWTHEEEDHRALRQAMLFSVMSFVLGLAQPKYSSRLSPLVIDAMLTKTAAGTGSAG